MKNKKQIFKTTLLLIISSLVIPSCLWAVCHGFSPNLTAASASRSDVSDCFAMATYGDTINIPACADGDCVWDDEIAFTKDVKIVGAGRDATYLVSNFGETIKSFFKFTPDATARGRLQYLSSTGTFEITGISFKGGVSGGAQYHHALNIINPNTTEIRRVKIHNNRVTGLAGMFPHNAAHGNLFGVVYENIIVNTKIIYYAGYDRDSWDNHYINFGSGDNLYFEDNVCTDSFGLAIDHGGRFVARYNTVTGTLAAGDTFWENHGNQPGALYGSLVTEVYGNNINATGPAVAADLRGGKNIIHHNVIRAGILGVREEYSDAVSSSPYTNSCSEDGPQLCGIGGCRCQKINDTYFINNRNAVTGTFPYVKIRQDDKDGRTGTDNSPAELVLNREFWVDSRTVVRDIFGSVIQSTGTFDGTSGIGCGTLINRPSTCTTGVAYWATNQSCSDLTGMVGANPSTPISGTLYKCTSTNKWEPYYTPYTYPHPLRNSTASYTDNTQEPAPTTSVPPTIAVSPTIKDFGTLPINTSSPAQRFTVTTTGGNLNVDAISMTGTDATQFAIQNDSCTGKIIAPEIGSCTFDVKFSPLSVGTKAANVAIVDNDSNTSKLIAVSGTGASQIPAISFSPTSLSFSGVLSGTQSSKTVTVSNTGASFVSISSIILSGTNANQFSIPAVTDECTGATVAASGNCTFQIVFSPTSGGEKTANVNLTAQFYESPATLPLYGSAVVYPAPKIKISRKK
jgi:hypothetical protein